MANFPCTIVPPVDDELPWRHRQVAMCAGDAEV